MKTIFESLNVETCGRESCRSGHRYGPAMRRYYLLHLIASGRGTFQDPGRTYSLRAGQGFLIFPDDITTYAADEGFPWEYTWIGFSGPAAEQLLQSAGFSKENPIIDFGAYADTVLDIAYAICDDMSLLEQNLYAPQGGLLRLFAYLAQCSGMKENTHENESLRRAQWAMRANYERADYRIEDVADYVGLSRSQLFRIYKSETGMSPKQALDQLRLARARQLLATSQLTLTEIAVSSGYVSAARMGEVFRSTLHLTPTEYRKQSKK